MTRTMLKELGLTDEQVDSVIKVNGEDIENAKGGLRKEIDGLNEQIGERDKQLGELKKSVGDNDELMKQISDLQKTNADQKKAHEAEIAQLKLDNAVDAALAAAGARNAKAVKALLDMDKVKLGEDGKLGGWDEQLTALQESDAYLFTEQTAPTNNFKGFQPGNSGEVKPGAEIDTSKMTYSEMVAYKAANPDANVDF